MLKGNEKIIKQYLKQNNSGFHIYVLTTVILIKKCLDLMALKLT